MTSFWKSRSVWAWSFYDFANSAFATTILSVVFNVYFVQRVVPPGGAHLFGQTVPGTSLWGYTVSASMLVTFLLSPLLGTLADYSCRKKLFLVFFWLMGCISTAGLFFVHPGDVALAEVCFIAANVGFANSNVFYNAFLPDLCEPGVMGRVSGLGWAVGYVGGGLCLALNLFMIRSPAAFGLSTENFLPVRATLLSVALWWLVFGVPLCLWVKERPRDRDGAGAGTPPSFRDYLRIGIRRLTDTFHHIREYKNLVRFLAAYLVYNDGIETIIMMASIFGAQALGMAQDQLVLCFLMIQGVAFFGSLLFGWMADRVQHKRSLYVTLAVYGVVLLWAYKMTSVAEFWVLGAIVGIILGGSQAASRSFMGLLTPAEKSAEFFSFFGLVGKLTSIFGPLVFGAVSQIGGLRAGVLSLLIFFVVGGGLLALVEEPARTAAPPS